MHQKQTKSFVRAYLPYLPLLIIVVTGLSLSSIWQPPQTKGVLAYATNVSTLGLLESTNQQRSSNGKSSLSLNGQLNQAAQAKANDMANRNYWSHNTPEGDEPWIFIDQSGYAYNQAGENLAYGFDNSSDTVIGWMNSPSHRDNLLDSGFFDVGFGFANANNYQNSGPQTIVVAMYGTPQVAAATTPAPSPPQSAVASSPAPAALTPAPQPSTAAPQPTPTESQQLSPSATDESSLSPSQQSETDQPVTTQLTPLREPEPIAVARIQTLTGGRAPWSLLILGALGGAGLAFLLLKHGLRLRRIIVHGEQFILQHTLLDVTIVAFIALCTLLTRSTGVIR